MENKCRLCSNYQACRNMPIPVDYGSVYCMVQYVSGKHGNFKEYIKDPNNPKFWGKEE